MICDVLNTNKPGPECNTCDCIDQDDEVDHLEPEIEYGDVVHGMPDGENLLSLYRGESILPGTNWIEINRLITIKSAITFSESLTVPLTCICRPATPCKRITATERCPLSPDCERQLLESESTVKASCFGLCKKSTKGQETVWDEETMLASEMCPGSDYVCCDGMTIYTIIFILFSVIRKNRKFYQGSVLSQSFSSRQDTIHCFSKETL